MTKKKIQPEISIMEMTLLSKTKCKVCIAWNGTVPKNLPKWLLDIWQLTPGLWWHEIELSFTEILELFNLGIDVLLSRDSNGKIIVGLNEMGRKFGQR